MSRWLAPADVATLKHAHVWAFFPVFLSMEIQAPHWGRRAVYLFLRLLSPTFAFDFVHSKFSNVIQHPFPSPFVETGTKTDASFPHAGTYQDLVGLRPGISWEEEQPGIYRQSLVQNTETITQHKMNTWLKKQEEKQRKPCEVEPLPSSTLLGHSPPRMGSFFVSSRTFRLSILHCNLIHSGLFSLPGR